MQHVHGGIGIAEADVGEAHPPTGVIDRPGAVHDLGLGVEHLDDPLGRREGLLGQGEDETERLDRPDELQHQGDEGDESTEGQLALSGGDGAETEHEDQGRVRDDVEEGQNPARIRTRSIEVPQTW